MLNNLAVAHLKFASLQLYYKPFNFRFFVLVFINVYYIEFSSLALNFESKILLIIYTTCRSTSSAVYGV